MLLKITADGLLHWEHQKESHETIELSQKMGFKSGLIIGAPGSGKTFIGFEHALQTVQGYWEEGEKAQVFVLVPTKHIREQKLNVLKNNYTPETLQKVKALKDIHPELNIFVTAVDDFDSVALKDADVIISTYQFFNLHEHEIKENKLPVKYLIVDEAGFSASPSYQKVIHAFNPDYTLGLSIEDIKFEGKRAMELLESNKHLLPANRIAEIESSGIIKLSDLYQGNLLVDMSSEEHIRDFIDKKILADIRVKSIDFEVKNFATQSMSSKTEDYITVDENNERDFDTPKLYKDLNREKLNLDIYNDYVTKVPDYKKEKPTICTSLSIEHAQDLAKLFKEKGIAAEALHSKLSDKDQKDILERFERGEIKVLMTVEMLKLGYDFPEVETILQNRPIYSRHTYINAVGRIWRYFAGKDYCLIVDRTWNFERYASHNMHTVFNRSYKYEEKDGEQFFTTGNKDYLVKKEISYDFRNFLPVVDKKIEYAITGNQLNEWRIAKPFKEIKKLNSKLNKDSSGLKEIILNGIVFYKKDLRGLTVWTIKLADKEKFIENFSLQPAKNNFVMRKWEENYILVKQFLEEYGELPKKHHPDPEEKRLGNWIDNQKGRISGAHTTLGPLSEEQIRKLEEIGVGSPKKIYRWSERYKQLKFFLNKNGRLPKYIRKEPGSLEQQLVKWMFQVRKLYLKNKLRRSQINLLKRLDFPLAFKQPRRPWEDVYLMAVQFKIDNGRLPVPGRKNSNEKYLAEWMTSQKALHAKRKLDNEKVKLMEDIGIKWISENPWDEQFEKYHQFYLTHKRWPSELSNDTEERKLASWETTQRVRYHGHDKMTDLTPEQIKKLLDIGFDFTPRKHLWLKSFKKLRTFIKNNNRWPKGTRSENSSLEEIQIAKWVNTQRDKYKGNGEGKRYNNLSRRQIFLLEKLGMEWDPLNKIWVDNLNAIKKFIEENKRIPNGFKDEKQMYGKMKHLSTRWEKKKLSQKELDDLEAHGILKYLKIMAERSKKD